MKRLWCFSLCILVLLFAASCSDKEKCDCCGDSIAWDEAYVLTGCSKTIGRGYNKSTAFSECVLCGYCYRDAMKELADNIEGSILEEYLFEEIADDFQGSNLEQFLIDCGYSIKFIG